MKVTEASTTIPRIISSAPSKSSTSPLPTTAFNRKSKSTKTAHHHHHHHHHSNRSILESRGPSSHNNRNILESRPTPLVRSGGEKLRHAPRVDEFVCCPRKLHPTVEQQNNTAWTQDRLDQYSSIISAYPDDDAFGDFYRSSFPAPSSPDDDDNDNAPLVMDSTTAVSSSNNNGWAEDALEEYSGVMVAYPDNNNVGL